MSENGKKIGESLVLYERKKIELFGANEVLSCTEKEAYIKLEKDFVRVFGQNLKIVKLTPEEKYVLMTGEVKSINYLSTMSKKSFFGKVFK